MYQRRLNYFSQLLQTDISLACILLTICVFYGFAPGNLSYGVVMKCLPASWIWLELLQNDWMIVSDKRLCFVPQIQKNQILKNQTFNYFTTPMQYNAMFIAVKMSILGWKLWFFLTSALIDCGYILEPLLRGDSNE